MSHNQGKPFCLNPSDEQYVPDLAEIKKVFIAKEKPGLLDFVFVVGCFEKIKILV